MHTVYDRMYGDFPAKNTVYTLYIPKNVWFWPTLYIYGEYMVFLAGKSSYIRSHTVFIFGSGQPYIYMTYDCAYGNPPCYNYVVCTDWVNALKPLYTTPTGLCRGGGANSGEHHIAHEHERPCVFFSAALYPPLQVYAVVEELAVVNATKRTSMKDRVFSSQLLCTHPCRSMPWWRS